MTFSSFSAFDTTCMRRALALAWQGRYSTSPNPRVGCVVAINNTIVMEGFHYKRGEPHAEINALSSQPDLDLSEATVYVTLEPCSHFGLTPPCALSLIEKKVKKVVAAMLDPNPLVAGKGIQLLKEAGIKTAVGLLVDEAREINKGFLSRIERKKPFCILKMAMSLDGKIALKNGQSQWITSEYSRLDVQEHRAQACAILTAIGTVIKDNPRLNVRDVNTPRQPIRIVLDSHLKIPLDSFLVNDRFSPTWLVTLEQDHPKLASLNEYPHIRIIHAEEKNGLIRLNTLMTTLAELGIGELYIECGAILAGAFLQENLVDEMHLYQAPIILGHQAKDAFVFAELTELNQAKSWSIIKSDRLGNDIKLVLRQK